MSLPPLHDPERKPTEHRENLLQYCQHWQNTIPHPTFNAFARALVAGRLSLDPRADNFVSRVWWAGTRDGKDIFQYIATGEYAS